MKNKLRRAFLLRRKNITNFRKKVASASLLEALSKKLKKFDCVVSFASFNEEIDLWSFNDLLEQRGSLYLPKMTKNTLEIFQVTNIQRDLKPTSFNLLEPNPKFCKKIAPSNIQCILVPALAFDKKNNRMGYGRGFYDRFLPSQKGLKIGVGFKEQFIASLPCERHDQKVDRLYLF